MLHIRLKGKCRQFHWLPSSAPVGKLRLDFVLAGDHCTGGIEEVFKQKARQTVVVSVWGARWNAALGMFGLYVRYCVHSCCTITFSLCFFWGGWGDFLCKFVLQV